MSKSAILLMALLCGLTLAAVLYLRLQDTDGLARVGVLVASAAMAAMMVVVVGRAGGGER